jgi:hypothetical protein
MDSFYLIIDSLDYYSDEFISDSSTNLLSIVESYSNILKILSSKIIS